MNKILNTVANISLVTLIMVSCKSSFQSREAAQKESETNPAIFEDSLFIKGKLAGRVVSWGNFSDPKPELRQKYLGMLMGNYQATPGFSEVFPYDSCGNKDTRAYRGSEFYDLKGNLKLVIIEDIVDAKLCKGIGQYIVLTYKSKGEGYFVRSNDFLNIFRKIQTLYDDSFAYIAILKKHEDLFTNN
ncbi:hypothetical protein [Leptospira bouyouniensis]|uniref:Lipoprotein n=1 Tax=Leptospira bouyouniensis TaxID=2484911 RepID=A0ABY2LCL3_9LEPT|nr:hypothetical protein [Leptospira bouyouniensis]TGK54243.1 hypothetical protein EHQ10_00315 [Leptospira bouyouniensis]